MANLIRLKQIESGSELNTAANVGADFSSSVNDIVSQSIQTTFSASIVQIITNNVAAVLPDGVVSSSAQIVLADTSGQISGSRVIGDIAATSVNYEDIIGLPTLVSASQQISFDGVSNKPTLVSGSQQISFDGVVGKPTLVSSSIQISFNGISDKPSIVSGSEQIADILIPLNQHSESLNMFTASLDLTYATDNEVYVSQSNINIDMGEF
jgi:hypothetical protein